MIFAGGIKPARKKRLWQAVHKEDRLRRFHYHKRNIRRSASKNFYYHKRYVRRSASKNVFFKAKEKKNRSKSQLQIHKIVGLDHKLKIPRAHAPNQAIKYFIHNTDSHIQIPQANATNPQYKFKAANAQQIHNTNQAANAPNQAINSQMQDVLDGER